MTIEQAIKEYIRQRDKLHGQNRELIRLSEDFDKQLKAFSNCKPEIVSKLQRLIDEPCTNDHNNNTFWITVAYFHFSRDYLEPLCLLLEHDDDCVWHEGIVDIFFEFPDARCVPSLKKALDYDLPSDPSRHLAIKILDTLYKIGTAEAIQIIKKCLNSSSEEIRTTAQEILEDDL